MTKLANPEAAPPKRRSRVRRCVAGMVAGLAVLVFCTPYLLSTGPGTRLLVGMINGRTHGSIEIDDLSLRWLGPTHVSGLRVRDSQGRQVLSVGEANYAYGIINAATHPLAFKELSLDRAELELYLGRGGSADSDWPLESLLPRETGGRWLPLGDAGPLTGARGKLTVTAGRLRLVQPDGSDMSFAVPHAVLDMNTINDASGEVEVICGTGQGVSVQFAGRQWFDDGKTDTGRGSGAIQVRTLDRFDVGAIASFLGRSRPFEAQLRANFSATMSGGKLTLPREPMALDGGAVRGAGEVDVSGTVSQLRIAGTALLVDRVKLSRGLSELALTCFCPMLGDSAAGSVTLTAAEAMIPLAGRGAAEGASGAGQLDLAELTLEPTGPLAELLDLLGVSAQGAVPARLEGGAFVITEGGLHCNDLKLALGEVELRFRGSVGFDGSVDMTVSVPLRGRLAGRLGVVAAGARPDARAAIRIVGQRRDYRLDFASATIEQP